MRSKCFKTLLSGLERHTPSILKKIELQILLNATAAAFDRPGKMIWQLSEDKALAAYAAYTKTCLKDTAPDRKRVYRNAYRLGQRIRRISGFTEREDLKRLVFYLYSNIGIKLTGQLPGEILIPACYFSDVYTPKQCMMMSFMDWGIVSGIFGGGKLVFSERLTQGCGRCRALFIDKEGSADDE